jgi:hypothetical protein
MEITDCPTCGAPMEVLQWPSVGGTSGPVAMVKTLCLRRHWFLMPREMLTAPWPVVEHAGRGVDSRQ